MRRSIHAFISYKGLLALSLLGGLALGGCQGSPDASSDGSSALSSSTSSTTPVSGSQPAAVTVSAPNPTQVISASFNETPQYALSDDDLSLLKSQDVLSEADAQALASLVKH
jgi:hypothetical protein